MAKWKLPKGLLDPVPATLGKQTIGPTGLQALEESGYYTEGFQGETFGEYESWHTEAFGVSPFETAAGLHPGAAPADQSAAAWIRANPLDYSPEQGYTGAAPTTERGIAQADILQQRWGARREEQERESGMAMMRWLMGQSMQMGAPEFQRMAAVGMPMAQQQMGYQAPMIDYSGLMGVMGMERMEAEAARTREFDFTRDLLPSLISLGGSVIGGG